jgi:hypothetical protein
LISYVNANHYGDITDRRNYNCGSSSDFSNPNDSISLANNYNLLELIVPEGVGIGRSGSLSLDMVGFSIQSYPVKQANYAKVLDAEAVPTLMPSNTYDMCGTAAALVNYTSEHAATLKQHLYSGIWGRILSARYGFDKRPEIELFGELFLREGNHDGSSYQSYDNYAGLIINRLISNLTRPGNFLGAPLFYASPRDESGKETGYFECAEIRDHPVRYMAKPPTSGSWPRRSLVWNTEPTPGAPVGWVCTVGGSPGTWNAFGIIS